MLYHSITVILKNNEPIKVYFLIYLQLSTFFYPMAYPTNGSTVTPNPKKNTTNKTYIVTNALCPEAASSSCKAATKIVCISEAIQSM